MQNGDGSWTRSYPDGTVVQFNAAGREVSEADRNDNTTSYAYVPSGQPGAGSLKTITDPVGLVTTLAYDSSGHLSTITDPAGRVTTVTVDSNDNLTEIVDPDGAIVQYGYSTPSNHEATTETDPNGHSATAHYNSFGQLTSETLFDGTSTTSVDSAQSQGLLAPGGSGALPMTYQGTVTDPDGRTTTLTFDAMSLPTLSSDATGASTSTAIDRLGYLNPANPPQEVMLQWFDASSAYRAYWGADDIDAGTDGTPSRYYMGALPATGRWVRLAVPASLLGLDGATLSGMSFSLYGGQADWDRAGVMAPPPPNTDQVWVDDAAPAGATLYSDGGDSWTWSATDPAPYSGALDLQSSLESGKHEIYFEDATATLTVPVGGTLYAYVYLNPANPPQEVMLQWFDASSAYRAYWGADDIDAGTDGTPSRYYMGALPATGRWVRLAVPASLLGLDGATLNGMSFSLYGGQADWDRAGAIAASDAGRTTFYSYDAANRPIAAQDPAEAAAGTDTQYGYDPDGNLIATTDGDGHVTTYDYNARDELIGMTDPVNQGTGLQTAYTYDADGNLLSVTDPLGHATTYSYDQDNRETGMTDPAGDRTTYTYDGDGELTAVTDPNGKVTSYTYDALGRVETVTLPGLGSGSGSGSSSGSGGGAVYTYGYDADDNLLTVTDPLTHTTTYTYNSLDELTAVTDPIGTTDYGYDGDGDQTTVTDPLGHTTTYTFDDRDLEIGETDPSGGGTTTYGYDVYGERTGVTDPDDNVTSYTYDSTGRLATETSPTGGVTTYTYDLADNLTQTVDPDGHIIQYAYDADDRETTERWMSDGSAIYTMTITYDAAGRETAIQDNNSSYAYTYDDANRLTSVSDAGTPGLPSVTLTYEYDADGNRTAMDDSLGGLTSYTYDQRDELTSVAQSGSGVASKLVDFTYDAAGNLASLTRYSNLSGTAEVLATAYVYDAANRLTSITDQTSGGTTVASYSYTLDAADRLTSETQTWNSGASSDTTTYTYTNNNQLTGVTHTDTSFANESFSYDANGNRNSTGYTTGTGNELTSDGTYDYTFDADGNMVTKTDIATGVEDVYTYDFRNRLTEVQQVSGGVTTTLAQYTYDALDRRIGVSEGGTTTWTLYDGMSTTPVLDFNGSGTQTARYLYAPAVDMLLARETPSGGTAWYLTDRLGSVGDIVDNSGAVIDHIAYGAFGNVVSESNPSAGDQFKYAGMRYDAVSGLYYDNARWYDPASGRFVNLDPKGFAAGDADLYRYVGNSPTNAIDPSGLGGSGYYGPLNLAPGGYQILGPVNVGFPGGPYTPAKPGTSITLPYGGTYYPPSRTNPNHVIVQNRNPRKPCPRSGYGMYGLLPVKIGPNGQYYVPRNYNVRRYFEVTTKGDDKDIQPNKQATMFAVDPSPVIGLPASPFNNPNTNPYNPSTNPNSPSNPNSPTNPNSPSYPYGPSSPNSQPNPDYPPNLVVP